VLTEKQKIRRQWVRALRSGKYKQGRRYLRKEISGEDRFCCLGVLCELAVKAKVIPEPNKVGSGYRYKYEGEAHTLPLRIQKWAGLTDEVGSFKNKKNGFTSLVFKNDSYKFDFQQIADIIESEPEGLFEEDK